MKSPTLKFLKILTVVMIGAATTLGNGMAAATGIYNGSDDFISTPIDWEVNITIDEVGGAVVTNLVEVFDDDGSSGLVQGIAEIGPATPALPNNRDAQGSPLNTGPAFGRARVEDTLENIGDSSGLFYGDVGERLRITSSSTLIFELEWDGTDPTVNGEANICLMPIQLAIIEGGNGTTPATASYAYTLEVDGDEVFTSSMQLSGTSVSNELTVLEGDARTDGTFFSDSLYNTFGINFPAATYTVPMGSFDQNDPLEASITFRTIVEGPDNDWGGFAGPSNPGADPNIFIPSAAESVPEPGSAALIASGLLFAFFRRRRS